MSIDVNFVPNPPYPGAYVNPYAQYPYGPYVQPVPGYPYYGPGPYFPYGHFPGYHGHYPWQHHHPHGGHHGGQHGGHHSGHYGGHRFDSTGAGAAGQFYDNTGLYGYTEGGQWYGYATDDRQPAGFQQTAGFQQPAGFYNGSQPAREDCGCR